VVLTASVGIAGSAAWPHDAERLLHEADLAMYRAKQLGKGRCQLFDDDLRQAIQERAGRERVLLTAIEQDRLSLHYQPILDMAGNLVAVEALLRVAGEDGELLPPAPFIAVAEETGLISRVTEWVLRAACRQTAAWRAGPAPHLVVNVNVSGSEIGHQRLTHDVVAALTLTGLPPAALALELTETALLDAAPNQIRHLQQLKDSGLSIGLDDFGAGYTSLQHLRSLPIDFVKLDMSFISDLPTSPADRAIVAAMATLSRELGYQCVAEGVETDPQLVALRQLGVSRVQGYLPGRPVPAGELTARIAAAADRAPAGVFR
jgi:predicted signal transduction protein with EAL and GGDEF domain